jgi:hypothetical protein
MIYLIGGMPRVGKSTLAKMILERDGISWMPLDTIREMLNKTVPERSIMAGSDWWPSHHKKFFPFLRELVRVSETSFTYEGDSFLPHHAAQLASESGVRTCFLGVSHLDVTTMKDHPGLNDWVQDLSEEELTKLPDWIVSQSLQYEAECKKLGVQYFDVSGSGRETAIEKAYAYLLGA